MASGEVVLAGKETGEISSYEGSQMFPQLEALADSFTQSQYEAARLFEIAYYSLSNFPDLSTEIRLSAHSARTSHEFSSALMKKFSVTGFQIVNKVIPLIFEAIDIGVEAVVKGYFGMIIDWSKEMKHEAEQTRDQYIALTKKLQEDIGKIRQARKDNITEKEELALKKKHEEDLKKAEEANVKRWEEEEAKTKKELEELLANRATITGEMHEGSNKGKAFAYVALVPVFGWIAAGIGLGIDHMNFKRKLKIIKQTEDSINKADDKRLKVIREQLEAKKAAKGRLHTIQQMYLKEELMGDESSLLEAVQRVGEADRQLDKLARFWGDMAVLLQYLRNETVAGEPFLENIQNEKCAKKFKEILETAKGRWIRFGEVCTEYVHRCEKDPLLSIDSLYGFLDGRVDAMTSEQKGMHIRDIQDDFKKMYEDIEKGIEGMKPIEDVPEGENPSGEITEGETPREEVPAEANGK